MEHLDTDKITIIRRCGLRSFPKITPHKEWNNRGNCDSYHPNRNLSDEDQYYHGEAAIQVWRLEEGCSDCLAHACKHFDPKSEAIKSET
jgi:hypothetical protein